MNETQDPKADLRKELDEALSEDRKGLSARFVLNAITGFLPPIGSIVSATANAYSEKESERMKELLRAWLKLQEEEMHQFGQTITEVFARLDKQDQKIADRITSQEYLSIIKRVAQEWPGTESQEKKRLVRNLLVNAASTALTTDDVIKLFVSWIDRYSDLHFKVIRSIYHNEGTTRGEIWSEIYHAPVREDSAEADLFKLVIHELSTGHLIRQARETDLNGNYLRKTTRNRNRSSVMTSAFEDQKPYVLTSLGKQFVHYTMNETTVKIDTRRNEPSA